MTLGEAIQLVTKKYRDEAKPQGNEKLDKQYHNAMADCPATMTIAHIYFAMQFVKTGNQP